MQHLSCVIYKGICSYGETYIGETIRNCKIRWDEHDNVNTNSEHAKHLAKNIEHKLVGIYLQAHLKIPWKEEFLKHTL